MAKRSSGMPEGFKLQATREDLDAPVEVGDYLDRMVPARAREESAQVVELRPAAPAPQPEPVAAAPVRQPQLARAPQTQVRIPPVHVPEPEPVAAPAPRHQKVAARKQINMSPLALSTLEEVLQRLRDYSGQKDIASSEVIAAFIMAAAEAMPHLDLTRLPRRGPWGSPSATNFPTHLKRSFITAIAQLHAANYRDETRR